MSEDLESRWRGAPLRDLIVKYENLPGPVPTEELYTNEFLPRLVPE